MDKKEQQTKRGILISASGIRSVWQRNNLENFKKRLKALEAKVAQHFNRRADNSSRDPSYGLTNEVKLRNTGLFRLH